MEVKCVLSCRSIKHQAIFLPFIISCTDEERKQCLHHEVIDEWARKNGYDPYLTHEEGKVLDVIDDWEKAVRLEVESDTYEIHVVFTRSLSEDREIAVESFPKLSEDGALIQQFRLELQNAYDKEGIAGQFQIVQIQRNIRGSR